MGRSAYESGVLEQRWRSLLDSEPGELQRLSQEVGDLAPLAHELGLTALPIAGIDNPARLPLSDSRPTFRDVTDDTLSELRFIFREDGGSDDALNWSETLLRFCEIRRHDLESRARRKWETHADARMGLLHLATLFADCYLATDDFRYINTLLKLLDLRMLSGTPRALPKLGKPDGDLRECGLGIRTTVIARVALARLERQS